MTADAGRTIILYWGDESPQPAVAGIREKGFTFNGDPIDQTNSDSSGWQSLIDKAAVNSIEIAASGVLLDDTLRQDWFTGASAAAARLQTLTAVMHDGGTLAGKFYLSSYSETGPHDGETTFDATFKSSGPITYTP